MRALSPVAHLPPASPISAASSAVNAFHRIDFSYCPFGFTQLKVGESKLVPRKESAQPDS
jgi:hypothetical protein